MTALSQQIGLLSNDALLVAVMQAHGLTKLASNDPDFDRVPGITRYAPHENRGGGGTAPVAILSSSPSAPYRSSSAAAAAVYYQRRSFAFSLRSTSHDPDV